MKYVWSHHAASERLPERSGLTQLQIEELLNTRKYIVQINWFGSNEEHHLIWDHIKQCLIDIPIISKDQEVGFIPTVLPVTYGSGYCEWQRAEAERAWLHPGYYVTQDRSGAKLCSVEVILTKHWFKPSGWPVDSDMLHLLTWFIHDPKMAEYGDEGMVALFRDHEFCSSVKLILQEWEGELPLLISENETVIVHLKKPGAHRHVPLSFFLLTP